MYVPDNPDLSRVEEWLRKLGLGTGTPYIPPQSRIEEWLYFLIQNGLPVTQELIESIAPPYDPDTVYHDGDYAMFNGVLKKFNGAEWQNDNIVNELGATVEVGRFLSTWDSSTGLPDTDPQTIPYDYLAGDFYIISAIAAEGSPNYMPDGAQYTGEPSTVVDDTHIVKVNDMYFYDGTHWIFLETVNPDLTNYYTKNEIDYTYGDAVSLKSKFTPGTWNSGTLPYSSNPYQIAFGAGKFVMPISGHIAYSSDGKTWTASERLGTSDNSRVNSVTYGNGKFIVGGVDINTHYSTDGINWTEAHNSSGAYYIAFGNGLYVYIGGNTQYAYYSSDGITWTSAAISGGSYGNQTLGLFFINNKFYIFAKYSYFYSTDAIHWTSVNYNPSFSPGTASLANGRVFLGSDYNEGLVLTSTDMTTWTKLTMPVDRQWKYFCYANGYYIANLSNGVFAYSTNLSSWTVESTPKVTNAAPMIFADGVLVTTDMYTTNAYCQISIPYLTKQNQNVNSKVAEAISYNIPTPSDSGKYLGVDANGNPIWQNVSAPDKMDKNNPVGTGSFAMNKTGTLGSYAFAEGFYNEARGDYSHAEGYQTHATGKASHSENDGCTASGNYSHAEGSSTQASGAMAHAEGNSTKATASYAHAEGAGSEAKSYGTHAEGDHAQASSPNQHAQGKYNVEDTDTVYADIIGGGEYGNQKNISATEWTGTMRLAGDLYVKCNSDGTDPSLKNSGKKVATEEFVGAMRVKVMVDC